MTEVEEKIDISKNHEASVGKDILDLKEKLRKVRDDERRAIRERDDIKRDVKRAKDSCKIF